MRQSPVFTKGDTMLFVYNPQIKNDMTVKAWLDKHEVKYTERIVTEEPITADDLLNWADKGRLSIKAFLQPEKFSLRAILINNQMALMERAMRAHVIAAVPQFIPHPIMVGEDFVVMGMDNAAWRRALNILS